MGLIGGLVSGSGAVETLGRTAMNLSRVFRPDATEGQRLGHETRNAALDQMGDEFVIAPSSWFDRMMNGINRLPRPMLAMGTLGLFVYAMADPVGFAARMQGLAYVPEPLWWLLGAIVGFYFGARELHYVRKPSPPPLPEARMSAWHVTDTDGEERSGTTVTAAVGAEVAEVDDNPALAAWRDR